MQPIRLLALSSSRVGNGAYLEAAVPVIRDFLGTEPLQIAFIPFASVDRDYEQYAVTVREGLAALPHTIQVVHPERAAETIAHSDVIMVGGGNTFKLLHDLYEYKLMEVIRNKVHAGMPYIGWSAGSNITGLTIATTNDMPVIEPESFRALRFLPFQLNPHYINIQMEGFHGETRDQRLSEFIKLNPAVPVAALPEGTALLLDNGILRFTGQQPGVLFRAANETGALLREKIAPGENLSFLL